MKRGAVLVFIAVLLTLGKFSTLSGHRRITVADQGGDAGDDGGDDDSDDTGPSVSCFGLRAVGCNQVRGDAVRTYHC